MESDADAILEKKHLEGLKRMKEGNEYTKQLLAQHPDADDVYIALGAANYTIGSLNAGRPFVLWFGGIHGDKKLGMEQLRQDCGERALLAAIRENPARAGGSAGKTKRFGAEAVSRVEPGVPIQPAICGGVRASDRMADSG